MLTIEGRRGPQERPLNIKETAGTMTAELGGGRGGPTAITDITAVQTVEQQQLVGVVGRLSAAKMQQVCRALGVATGCA